MVQGETLWLLYDIRDAAEKIFSYTDRMNFKEFIDDDKTIDAIIRNFQIIGEAAGKISREFTQVHGEIPWKQIVGFRNRIIHGYSQIDYEMVWKIKEENLPPLYESITKLVEESD